MGASQLQLRARLQVSKVMSPAIWKWKWRPPLIRDSSQTLDVSVSPVQSRSFASNSIEDRFSFSESESKSSPMQRRSPPDPRDGRRLSKFSGEVSPPFRGDNQNHRIKKPSEASSFRYRNEGSISQQKSDSPSQEDFSFLEKFKLNTDNLSSNQEKTQQSSPPRLSESLQEKQAQPQRPPEAEEIFKKMKETGLIPNAVAMLDGLCKDGLVQEAMKLFGLMREKGTIPEIVIYTAVVDGFCKAEKLDEAIRIFRKMQKNGISPNAFSFGVLIQGLYKCKKLEEAIEFCLEMLEAGHSPNITTFVGLTDELCKERGVDEARKVIETLQQRGLLINEKALREFLNKKAPFSPTVWEAIFGKKQKEFF